MTNFMILKKIFQLQTFLVDFPTGTIFLFYLLKRYDYKQEADSFKISANMPCSKKFETFGEITIIIYI